MKMDKLLAKTYLPLYGGAIFIIFYVLTHKHNDNNSGGTLQVQTTPYYTRKQQQQHVIEEGIIFAPEEVRAFRVGYDKHDDLRFVQYIRQFWIVAPSKDEPNRNNNNTNIKDASQVGQSVFVDNILKYKENGFFVECGAANGEILSNTIYLERKRGWTGLLIEANNKFYRQLLTKHRKAYSSNVCLSTRNSSEIVSFRPVGLVGGLDGQMNDNHLKGLIKYPEYKHKVDVQCFNLYSLMLAIGHTHIDYFSLDIEGPELDVLNTIPFNKLHIDIIGLEYRSWGKTGDVNINLERLHNFRSFFEKQGGYKEIGILPHNSKDSVANDKNGLDVFFQKIKK